MKDSYIINHTSFCSNFGCNYYLCIRITGKSDFLFPFQLRDGFLSSFQIGVKVHKINQRICNICRCVIFSFTMWVMQSLCCFFLTVTILKYWHTRFRGTWIRRNYIFWWNQRHSKRSRNSLIWKFNSDFNSNEFSPPSRIKVQKVLMGGEFFQTNKINYISK